MLFVQKLCLILFVIIFNSSLQAGALNFMDLLVNCCSSMQVEEVGEDKSFFKNKKTFISTVESFKQMCLKEKQFLLFGFVEYLKKLLLQQKDNINLSFCKKLDLWRKKQPNKLLELYAYQGYCELSLRELSSFDYARIMAIIVMIHAKGDLSKIKLSYINNKRYILSVYTDGEWK